MMHVMKHVIGSVLIILGLSKVTVGVLALALSANVKPHWFKQLTGSDDSTAGRVLETVLVVFGLFSLIHGMALLNLFLPFTAFAENHAVQYTIYVTIGVLFTLFYWLIVYRSLPVSKAANSSARYILMGIAGGLLFLITAAVAHAWRTGSMLSVFAAVVLFVLIVLYSLDAVRRNRSPKDNKNNSIFNDLIALSMIPFNAA